MSSWAMAKMLPMTRTARSPEKMDKAPTPRWTRIRAVYVASERRLRDEFKPQLRADADERRGPLRRRATDRLLPRVDGVAVPRRAHRAPPRRLRGLLGRRRAAARRRPVRGVVLVGADLVCGDFGLGERLCANKPVGYASRRWLDAMREASRELCTGERRPRRHALEELAGRDGVLHRLRRGELMLNGGSKHRTFLANFSKSNPSRLSISRSSSKNRVGRLPPSPNTGAMSSLPMR